MFQLWGRHVTPEFSVLRWYSLRKLLSLWVSSWLRVMHCGIGSCRVVERESNGTMERMQSYLTEVTRSHHHKDRVPGETRRSCWVKDFISITPKKMLLRSGHGESQRPDIHWHMWFNSTKRVGCTACVWWFRAPQCFEGLIHSSDRHYCPVWLRQEA